MRSWGDVEVWGEGKQPRYNPVLTKYFPFLPEKVSQPLCDLIWDHMPVFWGKELGGGECAPVRPGDPYTFPLWVSPLSHFAHFRVFGGKGCEERWWGKSFLLKPMVRSKLPDKSFHTGILQCEQKRSDCLKPEFWYCLLQQLALLILTDTKSEMNRVFSCMCPRTSETKNKQNWIFRI